MLTSINDARRVNYASAVHQYRKPSVLARALCVVAYVAFGAMFGVIAFVAVTQ